MTTMPISTIRSCRHGDKPVVSRSITAIRSVDMLNSLRLNLFCNFPLKGGDEQGEAAE
jgi:hypothetical protein